MGELASFWNKPIISWVGTDPDFNDKTVFTTLGRTLGPLSKIGTFLVDIFEQYNWKRVVLISSNFLLWLDAAKAIRLVFKNANITIAYESTFTRFPSLRYMRNVLMKTKEEGRSEIHFRHFLHRLPAILPNCGRCAGGPAVNQHNAR